MLLFCIFYLFTEKTLDLQVLDLIKAVSFRLVCWGMRTWMCIHQYTFHCLSSLKTEFELIRPIFIFDLFFLFGRLVSVWGFLSVEINYLILLCWREYYYENRKTVRENWKDVYKVSRCASFKSVFAAPRKCNGFDACKAFIIVLYQCLNHSISKRCNKYEF